MSPSHRRATAQILANFAQSCEICKGKLKNHDLFIFLNFLLIFTHFMRMCSHFLPTFLCKIFTTEIVTAQENQLLECLGLHSSRTRAQLEPSSITVGGLASYSVHITATLI